MFLTVLIVQIVTKATISQLFQRESDVNSTTIKFTEQAGVKDCGLFSIAIPIAIAFGQNSAKQTFQQQSMQAHLISCFENKKITTFP